MSLSDKIIWECKIENKSGEQLVKDIIVAGQVRESVRKIKKQIIIHANMWSYMEETQRDIQIKAIFDSEMGEKLSQ